MGRDILNSNKSWALKRTSPLNRQSQEQLAQALHPEYQFWLKGHMKLGEGQETWGDMGKEAREGIQSQGKIESEECIKGMLVGCVCLLQRPLASC